MPSGRLGRAVRAGTRGGLPGCLVVMAAAGVGHADFHRSSGGLASPERVIDFEDRTLPRFTLITDQYAPQGVTFPTPLQWNRILNDFPSITGNRLGNNPAPDGFPGPLIVQFAQPQTRAAFAIGCNRSTLVEAWRNGSVVDSATILMLLFDTENFIGFENVEFDRIVVTQFVLSGSAGMLIDSIQIGPTEEACRADHNRDGSVDPDDLSEFITCFFLDVQFPGSCAEADFNGDGFRDPDDLADFITLFFPGCG